VSPPSTASANQAPSTAGRPGTSTVGPIPPGQRGKLADQFIRAYYDRLSTGDYAGAWSLLTPDFQRATGGFDRYQAFWRTITGVDIASVDAVKSDASWPIVARMRVTYTTRLLRVAEVDELRLEPASDGSPRIAGYRVVA